MSRLILNGKKIEIPLDSGFLIDDDEDYTEDDETEHLLEQLKIDRITKEN